MTPPPRQRLAVTVSPIEDDDLDVVAHFLARHFPTRTAADQWADAWRECVNGPGTGAPNHGFLLRDGDTVVGAYPTIYSTRPVDGELRRLCNLAAWCTHPDYRSHGIRLLRAILAQEGWSFTDLTPIPPVQRLNQRLGFRYLDTTTALFPNLPWPDVPGRVQVSADPATIRAHLPEPVLTFYEDHARCRWARHLVLVRGEEACYVQWRKEARRNLTVLASVRYASNPPLLRQEMRALGRHLLLRYGTVASLVESRLSGGRVRPSLLMRKPVARMYRSDVLAPESIDYLYSEVTSAP